MVTEYRKKTEFDIIIIGGGINGAAIARDAALRGLRVCLIEKNRCGEGTSSKSSKLAHGGLRYLESFNFSLVYESLRERDLLLKTASQYVKPLSFIYPIYEQSSRPFWKIKIGMWFYSKLAKQSSLPSYKLYSKKEVATQCPQLKTKSLKGGALYYDGQMQDKQLVLANIQDACDHGAIVYEQSEVIGLAKYNNQVTGVHIQSENTFIELFAKSIINATGPWSNTINQLDNVSTKPLVSPTKGVHLVVKSLGLKHGLTLEAPEDKRIFFILPWEDATLIGTTDTPYSGDVDQPRVEDSDREYLLKAANHYLKETIEKKDIVDEFVGLRPLRYSKKWASYTSRDFSLFQTESGLFHLFGGKYTSYRHMAQCAVDTIINQCFFDNRAKPCLTQTQPLPHLK